MSQYPHQQKYNESMKEMKFARAGIWVHELDRKELIEFGARLREERLRKLAAAGQVVEGSDE